MKAFHLKRALYLARASRVAYPSSFHKVGRLNLWDVDTFDFPSVQGFVGSTSKKTVLAFRGSMIPDADTDFLAWLDIFHDWLVTNLCDDQTSRGKHLIHLGYLRALDEAWDTVRDLVVRHSQGAEDLWVCGHSLGGALATLAGWRLAEEGIPVTGVYTFGSPRVGDLTFAKQYPVPLFRVENQNDFVPHFPPPAEWVDLFAELFGADFSDLARYKHAGSLHFIDWAGNLVEEPSSGQRAFEMGRALLNDPGALVAHHNIKSYIKALKRCLN
jgi:triacylglycerol lipase